MSGTAEITLWLDAARGGDRAAMDQVLATLYQELHTLAPAATMVAGRWVWRGA